VRAGAVIALLPPDVDTLAGVGKADGVVDAADRRGQRVLLAFPAGRTIRIPERAKRAYRLQAAIRSRPCSLKLTGKRVPFRWFRKRRVLHAQFSARGGKLVIVPCRPEASSQPVTR
jgi:hypothetical protein